MITAAAIKTESKTYTGRSHAEARDRQTEQHGERWGSEQEGFVTYDGTFLNRQDAYDHAVACGQRNVDTGLTMSSLESWMIDL